MEHRWPIAISAGLLAALWCGAADAFSLVTWVGFLGCSTFFAQTDTGVKGLLMAWFTNLSGVFWAWLIISASSLFDSALMGYALTGLVTMGMCLQASYRGLAFIPGTFIGCCATFALGPNILALTSALMLGGLLGLCMSQFTAFLIRLESGFSGVMQTNSSAKTDLQEGALQKKAP
ncbi:protein of unknown function DUF1097 [Shewanella denitrificans OS217]|jgi:hypothetical protein|uniref:DUF1097 domain-containing protein n=1 Tax=Shewanella denitrificans (strain OS217 / ATCC BAA-1090 / DSM 15013) TaxID=318161 RepID=Q12M24_SHEDO|nr:DUF1097 domain-containing protein [Shewanella denitrificans]ABE55502.1 protein of unknown function DUF1097 [Shewanella denitrificans OS217]